MSRPHSQAPGGQPPQSPFDLWRTTPGRSSFPFLWVILILALGGLFASGFLFRPREVVQQAVDQKLKDNVEAIVDSIPAVQKSPEMEDLLNKNSRMFGITPPEVDARRTARREPATPVLDPATAKRVFEAERQRRQLEAKASQRSVLVTAVRAREALANWLLELDRWDALSAKFLDGDEGKPVAGGVELVKQFRTSLKADRPSRQEYEQSRQGFEQLVAPIERAAQDPDDLLVPGTELVRALESSASRANQAATRWKDAAQEINALAILARRRGLKSETTLRQAVADLEDDLAADRLKEINAKLTQAEKEAVQTDATTEAAKVTAAAEMRKARAEEEQKRRVAEAEHLKKRQFARGDEIRRYLGSMMEKGFTQPVPFGKWASVGKATEEGPVSLSALRRCGCLDKGIDGQISLVGFMTHYQMDRTRWGMPDQAIQWNADQQRFISRAQQLLNEYGQAMVEEGLLAK